MIWMSGLPESGFASRQVCSAQPHDDLPGMSNQSPGCSTTGVALVSLFTRSAHAFASWVIGGKVL